MSNVINLREYTAQKELEELNNLEKIVADAIKKYPPKPIDMPILWDENEAKEFLTASNLDIAIMKLMDAVVLLDSCGKEKESNIINTVAAKLLGIDEDY